MTVSLIYIILISISILSALYYIFAILFLRRGLQKVIADSPAIQKNNHTFSILIAARNEEQNIAACLHSVLNQTIPADHYEVIIVNDRSTDKTASIVEDWAKRHHNLSLLTITSVPNGVSPKKHAISQAYCQSKNEIIAITDADCMVPATWLESISRSMTANTGLVQGITSYHKLNGMNDLLYGVQALDFLSHGVIAAAAMGANLPINGNANNMAYRRRAFEECKGYAGVDNVISGDDDLLLQKIWRSKNWHVRFMATLKAAVVTKPCLSWSAVFEQRKRWASKTVHYTLKQRLFLSGIFLFYCTLVATVVCLFFNPVLLIGVLILILLKSGGEALLIFPGTNLFGQRALRKYFIIASLIQLPLTLSAVVAGVFGKFNWKDQTFTRKA